MAAATVTATSALTPAIALVLAVAAGLGPAGGSRAEGRLEWGAWHALVAFEHAGGAAQIGRAHPPESELPRLAAGGPGPDFRRVHTGAGGAQLRWLRVEGRPEPEVFLDLLPIDLAEIARQRLESPPERAAAYLYRSIDAPEALRFSARIGSAGTLRVWLNGELLHEVARPRALDPLEALLELSLAPGRNHLLVKLCRDSGELAFSMQVEGEEPPFDRLAAQRAVGEAIDRGVDYLLSVQQRDGSFAYNAESFPAGQTALSVYTLLKSGLSPRHHSVQRALAYLRARPPARTYSAGCLLLALAALPGEEHRGWREGLALELASWQSSAGYGYPDRTPDLSNTQFAALGLWAAAARGAAVPARVWRELVEATLRYECAQGGFSYHPGGQPTGSMTAAGLAVLAIAMEGIGESRTISAQRRRAAERARERGLAWLEQNYSRHTNPMPDRGRNPDRWFHYYLYGVERVAALERLERIGAIDWYWQGAAQLVGSQFLDGSFGARAVPPEHEPNTCFALLFLQRATARATGGGESHRRDLYVSDAEGAEVVLRASGDTPLALWISALSPAVLERYATGGERERGLRVRRVEYLSDGELLAAVDADPTEVWRSETFAVQHVFRSRGRHRVEARMHVLDPEGSEDFELRSRPIEVDVQELLDDWMLDYPDDSLENLLAGESVSVNASSTYRPRYAPERAADGLQSTAWLCRPDDAAPMLAIEPRRPVRAAAVLLSQPGGTEREAGDYDRITRVSLSFGRSSQPIEVELDPDPIRKTLIDLPRATTIRRLELRILSRVPGRLHPGAAGFSEIELR